MIVTCLDLEMNQPSGTIIQVGFCIGETKDMTIMHRDCMTIHTKEVISDHIVELTGIKQEDVDDSTWTLADAYERIRAVHSVHGSFINPLTWGGGDTVTLREQLGKADKNWLFGRRWIDAKTVFIAHQMSKGFPFEGGLGKSMRRLGMEFQGEQHNAMSDACNTFRIYCELLRKFK